MQVTIDGRVVEVEPTETILDVAKRVNIDIPTLCYDPDRFPLGSCRICIVEVDGKIVSSCNTHVCEGMNIETRSEKVMRYRKINLELLLARYDFTKGPDSVLKRLLEEYDVKDTRFPSQPQKNSVDTTNDCLSKDLDLCILCGQCIEKCRHTQSVDAICFLDRGKEMVMDTAFHTDMNNSPCVSCGACTLVCPTGALREVDDIDKVQAAFDDPDQFVVVQIAPSVRVTIGEEFGAAPGTLVKKELVAAFKKMGADHVLDTNFSADLTIMEESSELLHRLKTGGVLPLITSCSPGWVNYIETFSPDLLPHLSSCKSPQQMLGAIAKTYYAEKIGVDPSKMTVVSIMPCIAKKHEALREGMDSSGFRDVDVVLTARETARLIKQHKIDLLNIEGEEFDHPLGEASGAGEIFGSTGGVLEAALRTAYEVVTEQTLENLDFVETRGLKGLKTGSVDLNGLELRFAVVHGLSNAKILLEEIAAGKSPHHFIEVMACPGGCLGGGGQPLPTNDEVRKKRMEAIYQEDRNLPLRKSHDNPAVQQLYTEFLIEPLGEKSHQLLHTNYKKQEIYQ